MKQINVKFSLIIGTLECHLTASSIYLNLSTDYKKGDQSRRKVGSNIMLLATGDSQQSLSFSFRMGKTTVSNIVTETSNAVYHVLKEKYLLAPQTKEEWLKISLEFEENWNMPWTIGCIDGKRIRIVCPKLTRTQYYNHKGFFSIVLMAVCHANYCFTMIDLGQYGSNNDSGILASSVMGEMFDNGAMNLPVPSKIYQSSDQDLLYFYWVTKYFLLRIG